MDKSVSNQLYSSLSRNSFGGRTRRSSASGLSIIGRKSVHGGSGLLKKNVSSYSVSGRSNQSLAGIRSDYNIIESYGLQLPVLVNEALTFSEKNVNVSINCSKNGWAWVVHGRRLLIWQFKDTRNGANLKDVSRTPQRRTTAQCRELTLPHCDIGHKATLIKVFLSDGQQMASCLAASPTGDVRYWPSIAHDGSSIDLTGILDGQEFDYLLEIPPNQGYLIVTTTCSLLLLQLQIINGRYTIQHKTIKQPSGFLGGIGKKFASIIIGINNANDRENKFVKMDCEKTIDNSCVVVVLADKWVQRWQISNNGSIDQLVFEDSEIIRKIRDEFHQKFWINKTENMEIDLSLLDMHVHDAKTYVLAGAVYSNHTPQMHYAIAVLTPNVDAMRLAMFIPLKFTQFYSAANEGVCLMYRFTICRSYLYIYGERIIYPVNLLNLSAGEVEAEKIEFQIQDDRILSAAVCGNIPLFFSRSHGLMCVSPTDFDSSDFANTPNSPDSYSPSYIGDCSAEVSQVDSSTLINVNERNLCMYELDPEEIYNKHDDDVSKLKAAFVYRMKGNNEMCNKILKELLHSMEDVQIENQLDRIVITIAEDLAEDIPAGDPRWDEMLSDADRYSKHALGSSSSLQIITQLKEKTVALRHFVDFLHASGLWERISALPCNGGGVPKPTCYTISDINEKIIAAIALKKIQDKYNKLVNTAINRVLAMWKESPQGNLTAQDLFYVKPTKFENIFKSFIEIVEEQIDSQSQALTISTLLSDINTIVLQILNQVITFREHNESVYTLPAEKSDLYEYLPWTAMSGRFGARDAISTLIDMSVKHGARTNAEPELKQKMYNQIMELIDFILDGRKHHLDSIRDTEKYSVTHQQFESQRRDFISLFIDDSCYEHAAKLAEKYLDFHSLVIICDETDNQDRLNRYIQKYEEYDFSQFAINWHLRQNRQGEVFERFKNNQAALSQFLRDHPTLGWIQLVFNGDFVRAAKILFQLAQNETEFVQRKKSMLSLAKLSSMIDPDNEVVAQIEKINIELSIIDYQEQISENLLSSFGYDVENQKVLRIEEIINLFIAEENETANEFDFRKALELLNFMENQPEARHKIWCAAILRDSWTNYDMNAAVDSIQSLLFFKLIEVCYLIDGDFELFLPPKEDFLNSNDLGDLVHEKAFQYLLKLTYEYITDSYKRADESMDQNEN